MQIARAMFTQEEPSFEGRHYRTHNVLNNPRPLRGDIPIMIGGSGERKTLRMVAQYADGCNVFGDPDQVRHLLGVLEGHCERLGRDPAEITKTRNGTVVIAPPTIRRRPRSRPRSRPGWPEDRLHAGSIVGDPDTVAEQAQALLDAGLDGLTFVIPDAHDLDSVALAGETLAPLVGSAVA